MSEEKIYCGSGKEVNGQYGNFVNASICIDDYPQEHINEYNGKRYMNVTVSAKREPDQYGKTHAVTVNTWRPDASKSGYNPSANTSSSGEVTDTDDDLDDSIPF